jgi:acid phosphatase (class A)
MRHILLSLSLSLYSSAPAAPTMAQADAAAPAKPAHYVAPAALDFPALLPVPPAPGSPETRAEIEEVLRLQAARTAEQAARCRQIEGEDIFLFGSEVLGGWFTPANLPRAARFFTEVREDFGPLNRAAKAVWPRRRPPFADARVTPCVDFSDTGAYPSGHGIQSALWAGQLGAVFPEQAGGFRRRAEETLRYKLISGVHYASDLRAGRVVGEAVAIEFLKSPVVQARLAEIRAEAAAYRRK